MTPARRLKFFKLDKVLGGEYNLKMDDEKQIPDKAGQNPTPETEATQGINTTPEAEKKSSDGTGLPRFSLNAAAGQQPTYPPKPQALPAAALQGEVVSEQGLADNGRKEGAGISRVGQKNLAAVYIQGKGGKAGVVVKLSDQEAVVLNSFLMSHSYEVAAKEAGGITVASVKRMLRRPAPKSFLTEVIQKAAVMQNMDAAWLAKEMMGVWEGAITPSDNQMKAAKVIRDLVAPKGYGGVTVNVQQNSSYEMGKEALNAEWTNARAAAAPGV